MASLPSPVRSLWNRTVRRFRNRCKGTGCSPRHRPLRLEPLEKRELLAVATVSAIDGSADEVGNDPGTFEITLADADPCASFTVNFTLGGTANRDDYLVNGACDSGSGYYLSFESGTTAKTVQITPINDARNDPEQTVVLELTGIFGDTSDGCGCDAGNHSIGTPASATVTIADDDDDWTIGISATSGKLVEADENTGTFTITRSGDTDVRYPITVDFAMSGIARRGIDYILKRADGSTLWGNCIQIPANQTSVTVTVEPINDPSREPEEDVCMTLTGAHSDGVWDSICDSMGCGCCTDIWGAGGPFNIDATNSSATITIEDDDGWKVSLDRGAPPGCEPNAIERLPGVQQDEGYIQVVRYDDPGDNAPASDTSYGVYVEFDLSGTADHGCDYYLSAVAPLGEQGEIQPYGGLSFISSRPDPLDPERTIETWSITIPKDLTTVWVKLSPIFDWIDEGLPGGHDHIPPAGDESAYGERVNAVLIKACWSGMGEGYNPTGSPTTAYVVIHDGAIVRLRTDSNNDGTLDVNDDDQAVKNHPDHPGHMLLINSDDDNDNGTPDELERSLNFDTPGNHYAFSSSPPADWTISVDNEDDLDPVELFAWVDSLTPKDPGQPVEIDIYFLAPNGLVMWSQPTKGVRIHPGNDADDDGRMDGPTRLKTLTEGDTYFKETFYLEANAALAGTLALYAGPAASSAIIGSDHAKIMAARWTVTRNQQPQALATSSWGATIPLLARQIGLDPGEWKGWLKETVPGRKLVLVDGGLQVLSTLTLTSRLASGQTLLVPNTILMGWFGEWGTWGKAFMGWNNNVEGLRQLGFHVVEFDNDFYAGCDPDAVKAIFLNNLQNLSDTGHLHGMYLMGHGDSKGVGAAEPRWFDYTVGPLTWMTYAEMKERIKGEDKYRLAALIIHACHGADGDARNWLLSPWGIWWGWHGEFNPFTTPYEKYLPVYWGLHVETEILLAGVVTTKTYGGRQETNRFSFETFTPY